MKRPRIAFVLVAACVAVAGVPSALVSIPAIPIPSMPLQDPGPAFIGSPATAKPTPSFPVPRHPFMAPNGRSNIHNDAYMTDAYTWGGPLGVGTTVNSTWLGLEECASITFDSQGRIVALCGSLDGARLRLIHPTTLATLAVLQLPPRSVRPGTTPFNDFCAAGYFYLDHEDRGVLSTNLNQVWVVSLQAEALLLPEKVYDLNRHVTIPDCLASVLPDWSGRLWFVSKGAVVGTIDPVSGAIHSMKLDGEGVFNSFALDETGGVYIVTDHAFYRFDALANGAPTVTWRVAYDRGTRLKPGMLSQGSGTSPTLFGNGLVAIADNADPKMNVEVYRRATGKLVCRVGVFADGLGATENSIIAIGNSLVVENNYGYTGVMDVANGNSTQPGVARVDVNEKKQRCTHIWTSQERSPTTVPKASIANGLVYLYTKPPRADGVDAWYLTAVDFSTGATRFSRLTGTGYLYNNHYAAIYLGPDGSAYIGTLGGLVRIADG